MTDIREQARLPSNRSFGALFSLILLVVAFQAYRRSHVMTAEAVAACAAGMALITLTKPAWLSTANRLWFALGLLMGRLVNPLVMGLLFIVLFAPVGLVMRWAGRDALALKRRSTDSYWIERNTSAADAEGFKNQY